MICKLPLTMLKIKDGYVDVTFTIVALYSTYLPLFIPYFPQIRTLIKQMLHSCFIFEKMALCTLNDNSHSIPYSHLCVVTIFDQKRCFCF